MKHLIIIPVIFASLLFSPVSSFAQDATIPQFDTDRSDDVITQLNNLQISAVSYGQGGGVAVVTATGKQEVQCFAYPCYPQPVSYFIRVQSDTILLLRNRARSTIATFTTGDHINVYGFLESGSRTMDALIMRDLDKPALGGYYNQINNLQVQTAPGAYAPATFTAFAPNGSSYQITVSAQTSVLYRDRRVMPLAEIAVGDSVNVYGWYNPAIQSFTAVVLRDMSRPGIVTPPPPISGTVNVSVAAEKSFYNAGETIGLNISAYNPWSTPQTLQFSSGCQVSYTIQNLYNSAHNHACTLSLTSVTIPAYSTKTWTLTHSSNDYYLPSGNYSMTAQVIGYSSASTMVTVSGNGGGSGSQTPVISSVSGPTTLPAYQTGTWVISAYGSQNNQLTYYVTWGDEPYYASAAMAPQQQMYMQTGTFTHTYANAGTYNVRFTVRNQSGQSVDSTLTVVVTGSGQMSPTLNSLSPSYGPVGTYVTAYGSGFAATGNTIKFSGNGNGMLTNISSYDGRTLSFVIPQYLGPVCEPYQPCPMYASVLTSGPYQISVGNGSTQSNSVTFVVQ